MLALAQIFEPIRGDLEKVDREFARHVQSQVELIPTIGRYIQSSGGKRVRPAVLLMASRLGGAVGEHPGPVLAAPDVLHPATLGLAPNNITTEIPRRLPPGPAPQGDSLSG